MFRPLRRFLASRSRQEAFAAYAPVVAALPLASVPLAHALVHAAGGLHDDLRRWLDVALAARAPTAIGQPSSRAVISVWHALQDGQASGVQVAAETDWALLHALGRELAALEAMRFLLRIHVVTVQQWLPGAVDAARALATSMAVWPDAVADDQASGSQVMPPR